MEWHWKLLIWSVFAVAVWAAIILGGLAYAIVVF